MTSTTPTVRRPTGTPVTRVIGIATLVGLAWFVAFGLFLSPDDAVQRKGVRDRKSTRLNSSHIQKSRMPSSA